MHWKTITRRLTGLLLAAAIACTGATGALAASGSISYERLAEVADDYDTIPEEFLDEMADEGKITHAELKRYAAEYQLSVQYVQRFFDDAFVYKQGNKYVFDTVDSRLAKNKYDFENLRRSEKNGQAKLMQDGKSVGIKGIDVSQFQGDINWTKVKADGVKFAFIRVGYRGWGTGKILEDTKFAQNMKNAKKAGVKVGVYFFSQAISTAEAKEEAKWVLKRIKKYELDYPVVFDIEGPQAAGARTASLTKSSATKITKAFCDTIKAAGYKPMIYSYTRFIAERLDLSQLNGYDKWVATYYKVPYYPYKLNILQYGSTGRVNGIKGDVDMNLAFTSYKASQHRTQD